MNQCNVVVDAELVVDVALVRIDGPLAQSKLVGNNPRRFSLATFRCNLHFAFGEFWFQCHI